MDETKTPLDGLIQELRRGTLVLAVLSQLKTPLYGYSLVSNLALKDMDIDKNTLYPLLRRLEKQELLSSEWNVEESRPRRYYRLSTRGKEVLKDLTLEWNRLNGVVNDLLNEGE
jgi:PadR family transcriptional regulator PadR